MHTVLYELFTLRPPFVGDRATVEHGHLSLRPPSPRQFAPVPESLEQVILACLAKMPGKRPGDIHELRQLLSVGWERAAASSASANSAAASSTATVRDSKLSLLVDKRQPVILAAIEGPISPHQLDGVIKQYGGFVARQRGKRYVCAFSGLMVDDPFESAITAAREVLARMNARIAIQLAPLAIRRKRRRPVVIGRAVDRPEEWLPDPEIEPRLFSFNSPAGACHECDGIGTQTIFDPDLLVPDPMLSLADGAIEPWAGRETFMYRQTLEAVVKFADADMDTPFAELSESARQVLLHGTGREKVRFIYQTPGQNRVVERPFEGVIPNLQRRYRESSSDDVREALARYINKIACPACSGSRLNRAARHIRIAGLSLPQVTAMPLRESKAWIQGLSLSKQQRVIADRVVEEISARLGFMIEVGLDYLSLERTSGTLSGGEAQRIRLATQIGSALVGVLYILDEPSIGLHQRDNNRLLATLRRLRDLGNSVIVVEHDEDAIRSADWVIDMGPLAGEHGGEVIAQGGLDNILQL